MNNAPSVLKSALPGYEELLAIVQRELGADRRPLLVGIDGPTCVAKSSLASWLGWQLGMPALHLDLYSVRGSNLQQWRTDDLGRVLINEPDQLANRSLSNRSGHGPAAEPG
jgi:hypothetical protein